MDDGELQNIMDVLHSYNVMPALSCGMHPGIVNAVKDTFGIQFLANTGGAIHGHPNGSRSGATAMRSAIDQHFECEQYKIAIDKWGLVTTK